MTPGNIPDDKYTRAAAERQRHVDAVLSSPARKKVVVAGPGTGKTYLFKEMVKGKPKTLTLSFINALVDDLSLELSGISEVRTLHGFALSELHRLVSQKLYIFPGLSDVIRNDSVLLRGEDVAFDDLLHDDVVSSPHIEFYRQRKDYYGNVYGLSSVVYALVQYFRKYRDKLPAYDQVVVDEFQDFNKLEVALIDLLAERSPVLLAGDDDQALYDFKRASAESIRRRHGQTEPGYAPFTLPYCSRCTRVIVEATNDITKAAKAAGLLSERINKTYEYFDDEAKDAISDQHKCLGYKQVFDAQIPWFIVDQLRKAASIERKVFDVLIISPTRDQARRIVEKLRAKGLKNIAFDNRKGSEDVSLQEGLRILLGNKDSNLGWRLVASALLKSADLEKTLKKSAADKDHPFAGFLSAPLKREVRGMLTVMRAIRDGKAVDKKKVAALAQRLGLDHHEMSMDTLKDQIVDVKGGGAISSVRGVPIKATTVQSSKGLAADYVFITHFDDFWFIGARDRAKLSDRDVCSFLVALTRAKKRVFLVSSKTKEPLFLEWIAPERIERL